MSWARYWLTCWYAFIRSALSLVVRPASNAV